MSEQKSNPEQNEEMQPEQSAAEEIVAEEGASVESSDQQINSLKAELEAAQEEVAKVSEQALRAQADAQNVKRRAEQDVEKAHKFALEKFSADLLPVIDSLERAVDSANAEDEAQKAMVEGMQMTLKMFQDALGKYNLVALDPVGEPFDPQFHEAMSMQENADVEPGTVIAAFQKGYTLNGRLVRPAMVVVSKASQSKVDEQA
ncbi:nucleotide exchange factor GrpE [Aestuariirhabdus sp. Z084]|uniref:nucleotide exchange factor GrpE n=1 Tax=Aestuariirhabdus haliotis TaxID=2918751 RepID=UPI00201B3567|nr:nucleotide exchange factor GrpE [Aestuariirhabdus haliotis]MCL6415445.1 nucleotide exchange factor GrpE [Aestuariirhabdus haliotis]MCL6419201.1 nucleotide exchange factor GrpE [Aestuariirhabdus haliotis]